MIERIYYMVHYPFSGRHIIEVSLRDSVLADHLLKYDSSEIPDNPISDELRDLIDQEQYLVDEIRRLRSVRIEPGSPRSRFRRHRAKIRKLFLWLDVCNIAYTILERNVEIGHLHVKVIRMFLIQYAKSPTGDIRRALRGYLYQIAKYPLDDRGNPKIKCPRYWRVV